MPTTAEQQRAVEHIGETAGMKDHDRDLINELSRRLDTLWRCDQYIANAEGHDELIEFWRSVKKQEQKDIDRMRELVRDEISKDCF
jgi:hypothetical protein